MQLKTNVAIRRRLSDEKSKGHIAVFYNEIFRGPALLSPTVFQKSCMLQFPIEATGKNLKKKKQNIRDTNSSCQTEQ